MIDIKQNEEYRDWMQSIKCTHVIINNIEIIWTVRMKQNAISSIVKYDCEWEIGSGQKAIELKSDKKWRKVRSECWRMFG